jgi:hypothetical protein
MIDNGGYYGLPPVYSYGAAPIVNRSGNMTTITTQAPDYATQAEALMRAAGVSNKAQKAAQQIREQSLGATTLVPGQEISGSLYFATDKITKATLLIPIGNAIFEFQFPGS